MRKQIHMYSLVALFVLAGFGVVHSAVSASDPGSVTPEPEAACSKADDDGDRATASAMSSPYYCICCDNTGDARCCSKC